MNRSRLLEVAVPIFIVAVMVLSIGIIALLTGTAEEPFVMPSERPEKIDSGLWEAMTKVDDDRELVVSIHLKSISDGELSRILKEETGLELGTGDSRTYQSEHNRILRRENSAIADRFLKKYVNPRGNIVKSNGGLFASPIIKATKADIIYYSSLPEVVNMFYFGPRLVQYAWSAELEYEIKKAYSKTLFTDEYVFDIDDIEMIYYGSYSGYEAVQYAGLGATAVREFNVGGHRFTFGTTNTIIMYKDGAFAELQTVFNQGGITQEDIDRLYEAYMSGKGIAISE